MPHLNEPLFLTIPKVTENTENTEKAVTATNTALTKIPAVERAPRTITHETTIVHCPSEESICSDDNTSFGVDIGVPPNAPKIGAKPFVNRASHFYIPTFEEISKSNQRGPTARKIIN